MNYLCFSEINRKDKRKLIFYSALNELTLPNEAEVISI